MVVVVKVDAYTVDVTPPSRVSTSGHISSTVIVTGGCDMVVVLESVHGGNTKVQGGWHATVGSGSVNMSGLMYTTPEASPVPLSPPPPPSPRLPE